MNFRSSYYEKVGCTSVEEKKSLEILLRDNPVNISKLKQFSLKFSVPTVFRGLLWNFILEIYPIYVDSKEYVLTQKKASFADLKHALKTMRYIDDRTSKSKCFYLMFLLEKRATLTLFNSPASDSNFIKIADCLLGVFDSNDVETYFMTKKFYKYSEEVESELPKLIKITHGLLEKKDPELYKHFVEHDILNKISFEVYYPSFFSGFIADIALIRVFDRIIGGGSINIVIFLFLVICELSRYNLLKQTSEKNVQKIIETNGSSEDGSFEKSEKIVSKAIDSWLSNKNYKDFHPSKYKNLEH